MYIKVGLKSQAQKEKLTHAFQNKTGVTLQLNTNQLNGSDILGLTETQHNRIKREKKYYNKIIKSTSLKYGSILETILATLAGTLIPSLLGGKGLVLPGSKGKGLVLPDLIHHSRNIPILGLI